MLRRRALLKILVLVPVAVIASWLAIGPGGLVSYSPPTRIGVNTLFSYWISISAAVSYIVYFRTRHRSQIVFTSALVTPIVIHVGGAALNMLNLEADMVVWTIQNTLGDLLELTIFSLMMLASCICFSRLQPIIQKRSAVVIAAFHLLPLAIFGTLRLLVFPMLSNDLLIIVGYGFGILSVSLFLAAAFLFIRSKQNYNDIDSGYFVSLLFIFALSVIALVSTLHNPSVGWELSETLQMGGYVVLVLAIAVPFLKRVGFGRLGSYSLSLSMILLAYIPLLVTIAIESVFMIGIVEPGNFLAFSIIHIGAGSLAALTALLLYLYTRERPSSKYTPLIMLFITWSFVSLDLTVLPFLPGFNLGQANIPNVIGSLLTLILLAFTLYRLQTDDDRSIPSGRGILFRMSWIGLALIVGQSLDVFIGEMGLLPSVGGGVISRTLLLTSNLVLMFILSYLIFAGAEKSKGRLTIDLYLAGLIAFWIIPNILESYYGFWYAGWWVSEIILFVGLLAGPPLLAWLYVEMMRDSEESSARARLYADLLMHDVTNFNQMIMTSVELLGSPDLTPDQRIRLAKDGYQAISLAEQLISNVRLLSESEKLEALGREPVNLVAIIVQALDTFSKSVATTDLTVEFKPEPEKAFVLANAHLLDAILNILYAALQVKTSPKNVTLSIESISENHQRYWVSHVLLPGTWAPRSDEDGDDSIGLSGGALGLTAAQVLTESMGGKFLVSSVEREDGPGTRVSVKLADSTS